MNFLNMIRNNSRVSDFVIKIVAIVCMTIDHIGYFMELFIPDMGGGLVTLVTVLRAIGRLALPLFCYLIVQGALHTHHTGRYIGRLAIVGAVVLVFQIITEYALKDYRIIEGNIFIDLILGVLLVWSFEQKKSSALRLLAIIPIAIGILSYVCFAIEYGNPEIDSINWYPYYLRTQYGWYSIAIIAAFYLGFKAVEIYFKNNPIVDIEYDDEGNEVPVVEEHPELSDKYKYLRNIYGVVFFLIVCLILWLIAFIMPTYDYLNGAFQTYAMIAGLLLLFCSGDRGYDKKWFNYGAYGYYPFHLILLYIIFWIAI